jgi:excisionase family DNA binding protein
MNSINSSYISPISHTEILIIGHLTIQTTAEATGYNIQYLLRLLRAGKIDVVKVGQVWLIKMTTLRNFLIHIETTVDRRCGLRNLNNEETSHNISGC